MATQFGSALRVRTILVPHDLTPESEAALASAVAIAAEGGAALHVLHVRLPHAARATGTTESTLAELAAKYGGHLHTREDAPAHAICAVAVEIGADLIVMASHRRDPFARAHVSSAVVRTIRHAPCAVLVVRGGS